MPCMNALIGIVCTAARGSAGQMIWLSSQDKVFDHEKLSVGSDSFTSVSSTFIIFLILVLRFIICRARFLSCNFISWSSFRSHIIAFCKSNSRSVMLAPSRCITGTLCSFPPVTVKSLVVNALIPQASLKFTLRCCCSCFESFVLLMTTLGLF